MQQCLNGKIGYFQRITDSSSTFNVLFECETFNFLENICKQFFLSLKGVMCVGYTSQNSLFVLITFTHVCSVRTCMFLYTIYMYVRVYECVGQHQHACIHTNMHIFTSTCMHSHQHACIHINMHAFTPNMHAFTPTCMHSHQHACIHTNMHAFTPTCMYSHHICTCQHHACMYPLMYILCAPASFYSIIHSMTSLSTRLAERVDLCSALMYMTTFG